MQRLLAIGNVGHSEVDFAASSYIAYAMQEGTLFPIGLATGRTICACSGKNERMFFE